MWRRFWGGLGKCWSGGGGSPRRGRKRRAPVRCRPAVEALEERQVLSPAWKTAVVEAQVEVRSFDLLGSQGVLATTDGLINESERISKLLPGVRKNDTIQVNWDYALNAPGEEAVVLTIVPGPPRGRGLPRRAGKSRAILGALVGPDGVVPLPGAAEHSTSFKLHSEDEVIIGLATATITFENGALTISYEPHDAHPAPPHPPHPAGHGHKPHVKEL
jgi:hypothetical protein